MHETVPAPHNDPSLASSVLVLPAPAPAPAPPRWWMAPLRAALALPRAILRHPGRSLAIVGLLLVIAAGMGITAVWLVATHHLRAGREALQRYHPVEAIPHLQTALAVWPRDHETLLLAARAYRRTGAHDEADRLLDRLQELNNQDEDLALERIFVRIERGEPDRLAAYCRTLIERDHPATPLILEAMAKGYLRTYQPNKAKEVLQEWLQRQPDNPQALLLRGQVEDLQSRTTDAIRSYRAALTVDPSFDEARLRLCDALMLLGLTEEAQPHLEYLRQRVPHQMMVQVYLARVEDRRGRAEEAERILESVLDQQPQFAPALAERGKLALRAGQTVEAEKWLREAVAREPADYTAHYQLSQCLEKNGKTEEAQKEQEHLSQIEKDIEEIQAIAAGKMEQRPHDPDLHYRIGMISLHAGAIEEALYWLHSALKEDPTHQPTHKALMEHYQRIGDFGHAREHRQRLHAEHK